MKTNNFKHLKAKENYTVNKAKTKEFYKKEDYLCNCIDCALELLQSIKSINDSELSVLISFLEEDIEKYNGFYLLGI